jgi:signal transduction histidine kinase
MISLRPRGFTARPPMPEVKDLSTAPLVLYVDDERPNRIVFEASLRTEFRIKSVPDARTALQILDVEDVAVLVSDIRMPEMDGLELLRIVKEKYPRTLRMVITAFSDIDPILTAINEGLVARYIIKPFDRDEVMQALRWGTELWTLTRESAELLRRILQTERLASLGGLTALYVHDLRTPLMSVTATIEELRAVAEAIPALHAAIDQAPIDARVKERLLGRLDETPELVDDAKKAATLIDGMIQGLYDFIKPPKTISERPTIDPLPVIRHTLSMYQKLTIYSRAQIGYHGPSQLPKIRMSPVALTQVLLNLVGNAAQAVIARNEPQRAVAIDARSAGDMLELQIRDEGVGMAPDVLRKIGTPYFTTRAEGTGLGIANCHRLIGTAGGRIKIESEQGVGTTVTLLLPISA